MVRVTIIKVSDNWLIVKKHNITLAIHRNGYWIDLSSKELAVPRFLARQIRYLARIAKQYGLIEHEPRVEPIEIDELPYVEQRIAWSIHFHWGDSIGRHAFACYSQGKDPYINC